jgi:hypothetical protein
MNPSPAEAVKRAFSASVIRIRHGAPGVICSPAIRPSFSQRCSVEDDRGRRDRHDVAFRSLQLALETRDAPAGPQIRDAVGLEPMAARGGLALSIENARDGSVRVKCGEAAHEVQRLLIGSDCRGSRARQGHIHVGECAALPTHREMRSRFIAIDRENHFLDKRSQELFLIARRRRRRIPDRGEVGSKGEEAIAFFLAENAGRCFRPKQSPASPQPG